MDSTAASVVGEVSKEKLNSIKEAFAKASGVNEEPNTSEEPEEIEDEPTPEPEEEPADESEEESESDEVENEIDDDEDEESASEEEFEEPTIPESYRRAAIHQGWEEQELDDFIKSNPDLAEKTLAKIHKTNNELTKKFAEIGRIQKQPVEQPAAKPKSKTGIDIESLRDEYPDSPELLTVIESLNDKFDDLSTKFVEAQRNSQTAASNHEFQAVAQSIENFFKSPDLGVYEDFYGKPGEQSEVQMQNYNLVLSTAESLLGTMPLEEALERAHLSVSAPFVQKFERRKIKKTMKKRSQNISAKPGTRSSEKRLTPKQKERKGLNNIKKAFNKFMKQGR